MPAAQRFDGTKCFAPSPSPVLYFIITRPARGVKPSVDWAFGKVRRDGDELLHEFLREKTEDEESP